MVAQKNFGLQNHKETLTRLQAPAHIIKSHFSQHEKVEGYLQDLQRENFFGSDRLMSYDTMFGRVQFGYDPNKEQTFIFANIKTSIYDKAPSKFQNELSEDVMRNSLKSESENVAFSSKRKTNAASIFYKKDAKPWRESTLRPYLLRRNLEAFEKTMPFLQATSERAEREKLVHEDLDLKAQAQNLFNQNSENELYSIRKNQLSLLRQAEILNSIIRRKESGATMFFDKINFSFDYQKREIFDYYRNMKNQSLESINDSAEPKNEDDDEN